MFKRKLLLVSLISPLILSGCNNVTPEGDDDKKEEGVVSLKSAVNYLVSNKNYTLTFNGDQSHDIVFLENSIGVVSKTYPSVTDIYNESIEGVYRIRCKGNTLVGSEIKYEVGSLYSNDYVSSFYGISVDFLNEYADDITELSVKNKTFRNGFALAIGFTLIETVNINSLSLKYLSEENALKFDLSYKNSIISYTAHDFGTSKNEVLEEYLKNGGTHLTPDADLVKIRDLVNANNYMQEIYYFGEESGYVAYNVFNPHYFLTIYHGSTTFTGAMAVTGRKSGLDGCYYITGDYSAGSFTYSEKALYEKADIVEYYGYPCHLTLWDNFEFLEEWTEQKMGDYTPSGYSFYTDNQAILTDFSNNFGISSSFSGETPKALGIDYVNGETTAEDVVYFYYQFVYGGRSYVMPIPLYNFGSANIAICDYAYSQLSV